MKTISFIAAILFFSACSKRQAPEAQESLRLIVTNTGAYSIDFRKMPEPTNQIFYVVWPGIGLVHKVSALDYAAALVKSATNIATVVSESTWEESRKLSPELLKEWGRTVVDLTKGEP